MAAPDFLTSFDPGVASLVYDAALGSPTLVAAPTGASGTALRANGTAAAPVWARKDFTAHAVFTSMARFYVDTHGANAGNIMVFGITGGSECNIKLDSDRSVLSAFWNTTAEVNLSDSGYVCALDGWYWIQAKLDVSANPWQLKYRIVAPDGTMSAEFTNSPALAANTITSIFIGAFGGLTADIYFKDWVIYRNDTTEYPAAARRSIFTVSPTGKGTHVISVPNFSEASGSTRTPITDAGDTDSWTLIDDSPLNQDADGIVLNGGTGLGTVVAGTVSSTNGGNPSPALPAGGTPNDLLVCVIHTREVTDGTISMPAGWNADHNARGSGGCIAVFSRPWESGLSAPTVTLTNHTTGNSGDSAIARIFLIPGAKDVIEVGTRGNFAAAQNIGAISGITIAVGNSVLVIGGKLDDWTSVATLTGDGLTWAELTDTPNTLGLDNGLVVDHGVNGTASPVAVASKTFTVTGGTSVASAGIMAEVERWATPISTDYLEYTFDDFTGTITGTPLAVKGIVGLRNDAGVVANSITGKLQEGGSTSDLFAALNINSATTIYQQTTLASKPTSGAWTASAVDALTFRWGYTTDADSAPRLEAVMLEILYELPSGTTVSKSGGAVSGSVGSGTGGIAGAFPTTGILSSFTGSDEDPLSESAVWDWPINGTNNSLKRISNTIKRGSQNAATTGQAYRSNQTYGPDCESYMTMLIGATGITTTEAYGVVARIQNPETGSINGYFASWRKGTGWRLFKCVAGTFTQVGSTVATNDPVDNDKIGIECIGTSIKVKHYTGGAWVDRISVTDSSVTGAGYVGVELIGTTVAADEFGGGTIPSGTISKSGGATSGSVGSGARAIRHAKTNVAVSGAVGSGAKGIAYPRTGGATSGSVGSGARAIRHAKQNTGISGSVGSGSKSVLLSYAKTGGGTSGSVGSGARATRAAKTGLGTSGSVGSGTGLKTILISKTGGATSGSVGSGARAYRFARTGGAVAGSVGSGSKAFTAAKTGLGQSGSVGSGSRAYRIARTGGATSGSIGSGARAYRFSRTGGATAISIGSGARAVRFAKTGIGISAAVGDGFGTTASSTGKSGRGISIGVGSGAKAVRYAKTGGATSASTGSGSEIKLVARSGQGTSGSVGSGARATRAAKTGLGISTAIGSGNKGGAQTVSKSGGAISVAIGSGSRTTRFVRSGLATSTSIGSGSRSIRHSKTGIGITLATGSGANAIRFARSGIGISTARGSGAGSGVATYTRSGGAVSIARGSGARTLVVNRDGAGISTAIGSGLRQHKVEKFVYAISEASGGGEMGAGMLIIGYDPTVGVIGSRGQESILIGSVEEAKAIGTLGES